MSEWLIQPNGFPFFFSMRWFALEAYRLSDTVFVLTSKICG